jgi:hypothetical protein
LTFTFVSSRIKSFLDYVFADSAHSNVERTSNTFRHVGIKSRWKVIAITDVITIDSLQSCLPTSSEGSYRNLSHETTVINNHSLNIIAS